jgi:hypothetical protein
MEYDIQKLHSEPDTYNIGDEYKHRPKENMISIRANQAGQSDNCHNNAYH